MMVLKGKQYSCGGVGEKVIQPWWYWMGTNTAVVVLERKQYSRGGVGVEASRGGVGMEASRGGVGVEAIQLWSCWRGSNTIVMV